MSSNLKPLVLHAHATGPNPVKVAVLLDALHLPYQVKVWAFGDGPNGVKGSAFTKINPNGRVPALEDPNTGVTSWESLACMNYLVRVYDKESKFGPGSSQQDQVDYDKWTAFLLSTLGPMMGQVNWYTHYNPTKNEDALRRYTEQTYRCFGVFEEHLKSSGGPYVLGKRYTAVDIHLFAWVAGYQYAKLSLSEYPHVEKWLKTVGDGEDVKAAREAIAKGEKV
ncbi:MAG: hypothetical protein M1827_004641 [Pycnora praestabilis]|nr:MAG: hypothetical protein M1827_004641 [Pycnora praestabilis]